MFTEALLGGFVITVSPAAGPHYWSRNGLTHNHRVSRTLRNFLWFDPTLLFQRLGWDPALKGNPFVAGINDILGIVIYVGIARLVLV